MERKNALKGSMVIFAALAITLLVFSTVQAAAVSEIICERNQLWGYGNEFTCNFDNTYNRCNVDGTAYDLINVCKSRCSADASCEGYSPNSLIPFCNKYGEYFFQDKCDENCSLLDTDTCEDGLQGFFGCTSHEYCDEYYPGTNDCDLICQPQLCGNGVIDDGEDCDDGNTISGDGCDENCQDEYCGDLIINNVYEECEPPGFINDPDCPQTTMDCSGHLTGTRDSKGNCGQECGCVYDSFEYSCVEGQCGAECDENEDCPGDSCEVVYYDGCEGAYFYDYNQNGIDDSLTVSDDCPATCQQDCMCGDCEVDCSPPEIQGECIMGECGVICERDGMWGYGHQYMCNGDGTYMECNADCGTDYIHVDECLEECGSDLECIGAEPMTYFETCEYGYSYLQDYCDNQCQIRDNNCESSFTGCTSAPECDEEIPDSPIGGGLYCTYQCDIKEICLIDGLWGPGHQYLCNEDNTYKECVEVDHLGYGFYYQDVYICSYYCSADLYCDGLPPMTYLEACDYYGHDFLQDYCDLNCHLQDDNCEDDYEGCTAEPECDEAAPTADLLDDSCDDVCSYHYCGDDRMDPILGEECEPPFGIDPAYVNNLFCPQTTEDCQVDGQQKGTRDAYGNCGDTCLCNEDPFSYECVEGECGAECDDSSDYYVDNSDCYYNCDYDVSCLFDNSCSLEDYCDSNVYYYNGECASDGCHFLDDDCSGHDYTDDWTYYCEGDDVRRHKLHHEFTCTIEGCDESTYWVQDELVENCNPHDGWYNYGDVPGLDDPTCEYRDYTCYDYVETVVCDYYVQESHDYDSMDGSYCMAQGEAIEDRDYYCGPDGMDYYADSGYMDCGTEHWFGGGNTDQYNNDPECEYQDYWCVDDGTQDYCTGDVTYTDDYDYLDAVECKPQTIYEGQHDYYCDLSLCDSATPSSLCGPGDNWYNEQCSVQCGSDCEGDECCDPNSCEETYYDECVGYKLKDWNGDRMFNDRYVSDYCDNYCSMMPDCACSDCPTDCSAIPEGTYCVEGVCGAECDENEDCQPYCGDGTEIYYYGGECDTATDCSCDYLQENCDDYDDDHNAGHWCDPSSGDIYYWFEDWGCGPAGCEWTYEYIKDGIYDDCEDTCDDTDGGQVFDQAGAVTDYELCDESMTECPYQTYDDVCEGTVLIEYYCDGNDAAYTTYDCASENHYGEWIYYCEGDSVYKYRVEYTYTCSPGGCVKHTDDVDHQPVEDCNPYDGWYNYGDDPGLDDPTCEYRDYTCVEDPDAMCDYGVTDSHDYDSMDGSYCMAQGEAIEDRDYYCGFDGAAYYTDSGYHDCGTEHWSGGGNTDQYDNDPSCEYTDYWCVDDGTQDYCTNDVTYTDDYDYLDAVECKPQTIYEGEHDYYCDLELCDDMDPASYCGPGDAWYNLHCAVSCGADCEGDECCDPNSCSATYYDECVGHKLKDWDGDNVLNDYLVEDYCENTCSGMPDCICSDCSVDCSAQEPTPECVPGQCGAECDGDEDCPGDSCEVVYDDYCNGMRLVDYNGDEFLNSLTVSDSCTDTCQQDCLCTDCSVDCSEPQPYEYCIQGVCDAECDEDLDCPAGLVDDYCWYNKECQYECDCSPGDSEYCPEPGTEVENICYYGSQECTEEGCSIQVCTLENNQYCDPYEGCLDVPCVDKPDITIFSDGSSDKTVDFPDGGSTDDSVKVRIPHDKLDILTARVDLTGLPKSLTGDKTLDTVVVNDVSGSMDDNCGPDGTAQPGETPCKINDMKNATKQFIETVLNFPDNMVGLTRYSTALMGYMDLTDNETALKDRIDTYYSYGKTCISCGINKGAEVLSAGTNEVRAMILMTDGNANMCLAGTCTVGQAKDEALTEAVKAYNQHGIHVYTVAFGEDADLNLMQDIASLTGGKFYVASETNISEVYYEIAVEITKNYPYNPWLDVGGDGDHQWSFLGSYETSETVNFQAELDSLKDCSCPGCTIDGPDCLIDLEAFSEQSGYMLFDNLLIEYCVYEIPEFTECYADQDCGGTQYGSWSEWDCDWSDVCDESAPCERERTIRTNLCMNPGTSESYCDYVDGMEYDYNSQERDTDGTECGMFRDCPEDGCVGDDWYDYPDDGQDTCSGGVCTEHSCAYLDYYYDEYCAGLQDYDGDGVPDVDDACPTVWGQDCNGCPNLCTGCAVMVCGTGVPTCEADNSMCPLTYCPFDGCGLGGCDPDEWADYPNSIEGTCNLIGDEDGVCALSDCTPYVTCTYDEECDENPQECPEPGTYWLFVETDTDVYEPGDEVMITGHVINDQCLGEEGLTVGFTAEDPLSTPKDIGQEDTDSNGDFSSSFIIPSEWILGVYTLVAEISGEGVYNSTQFLLENPVDHILITEVMYDTPGTDYEEEWFELYNPTMTEVDISGMRMYDNSGSSVWFEFPEGTVIGPGEMISVASDSEGFHNLYGCYPDVGGFHRPLANDGDLLMLTPDGVTEVDFVAWEGEVSGWDIYATTGKSIVRSPMNKDTDTESDWLSDQDPTPHCAPEEPEPPEAPSNVQAWVDGDEIVLSWNAPAGCIDNYNVYTTTAFGSYGTTPAYQPTGTEQRIPVTEVSGQMGMVVTAVSCDELESVHSAEAGAAKFMLKTGKNWIHVPLETVLDDASDLTDAIGTGCQRATKWNAATQASETWITGIGGVNFDVNLLEGYEVLMGTNKNWYMAGLVPDTYPSVSLKTGKNWVGLKIGTGVMDASGLVSDIGSNTQRATRWNAATQASETWISGIGGVNFATGIWEGYEVLMSAPATWSQ